MTFANVMQRQAVLLGTKEYRFNDWFFSQSKSQGLAVVGFLLRDKL